MLYILFSFLIIFPVLFSFGGVFQRCFGALWEGFSSKIVLGIISLMILWHLWAFFFPLNKWVEWGTLLVGWGLFLYQKSYQEFQNISKKDGILWGVLVLISALVGSGFPFILDHFGYYVPSIKWLKEFGLVKGITNLDWILGQMSPWHIFQSGFSHFSDSFLRMNSLLLMLFFLYVLEQKAWVMSVFSPLLFFFVQSPSPDLPSIIFSLIILNEVLRKNQNSSFLFGFSMLVFSVKPTMFWLPMMTFLYSLIIFKANLKFIGFGVGIGLLYVVKNLWVFGYPVFPMSILDLGISWKPYSELFLESREVAVLKTFDLQYTLEEISKFSFGEYLWNWMFLKGIKGVINTSFILMLVVWGILVMVKKDKLGRIIFVSILAKSIFVLWFSAQYRFFIEVFFVFLVVMAGHLVVKKWALAIFSVGSISVMSVLFFPNIIRGNIPSFQLGQLMQGFRWKQFYKPSQYCFNQYETYKVGNLEFNVPQKYPFGFDVDLPVIDPYSLKRYEKMNVFPQKNGETLKDGFIWKKLSKKEKEELREVLKKVKIIE